jgi:hypothetical protein
LKRVTINDKVMSSHIRILKTCEYCKQGFMALKTTMKTCSDDCAKRLYKLKQRNNKLAQTELKQEVKRRPKAVCDRRGDTSDSGKGVFDVERSRFAFERVTIDVKEVGVGWKSEFKESGKETHIEERIDFINRASYPYNAAIKIS